MRYAAALVSLLWAAAPAFAANPSNLLATGRTDTQLYVEWAANGNTSFTLDYLGPAYFGGSGAQPSCDAFPEHSNIFETSSDQVTIEGLQPFTWYHIHVHAIGPGESGGTNIIIVRTRAAGSGFEPLSSGSPDYIVCNHQGFTDDVLTAGFTSIRLVHITELRTRINNVRAGCGLAAFSWTDASLAAGVTVIRVVHVSELRTALNAAYTSTACSRTVPTYTDPTLTAGSTVVKAIHVSELRDAVIALESTRTSTFDGTYTGSSDSGDDPGRNSLTFTVTNGVVGGVGVLSGTVSGSGAITWSSIECTATSTGQITLTSSGGATATGTWSHPTTPDDVCGPANSGTWTATR